MLINSLILLLPSVKMNESGYLRRKGTRDLLLRSKSSSYSVLHDLSFKLSSQNYFSQTCASVPYSTCHRVTKMSQLFWLLWIQSSHRIENVSISSVGICAASFFCYISETVTWVLQSWWKLYQWTKSDNPFKGIIPEECIPMIALKDIFSSNVSYR